MPRLSKAQKEAREERKTAVAAQLAADAQTTSLPPGSVEAPPPPAASALSTNQPTAAVVSEGNAATTTGRSSSRRSNSAVSDIVLRAGTATAASPSNRGNSIKSRSKSPLGAASDMSTSEGSASEDEAKEKSVTLEGATEEAEGDEEEETTTGGATNNGSNPEVRCMWEDCGQVFTSLAPFINHLHDDHVGIHKARYACEWTGCPRKGKMQTSRFALLSHLRSHTGEKPFTCPKPECDKSFTRSDALAKHMRVQHNINPVSTRGRGSRGGANNNADSVNNSGGRASRTKGEDDEELLGEDSVDAVGDELLELAEGENVTSIADIEQSLALNGARSFAFTYENLFGPGAKALESYTAPINYADEDLGIVQNSLLTPGSNLGEGDADETAVKREEEEAVKVLETGRRLWIARERERAKMREGEFSVSPVKRLGADYDSDEEYAQSIDGTAQKRPRRSQISEENIASNDKGHSSKTSKGSSRNTEQAIEGATLKKLYLIEKAKLRLVQSENVKMRLDLQELREMEREESWSKRQMLEKALEAELGRDVAAIFSPPPSSPTHRH